MDNKHKVPVEVSKYETSEIQITITLHKPHWSDKLSGEDPYYTVKIKGKTEINTDLLGLLNIINGLIAKM